MTILVRDQPEIKEMMSDGSQQIAEQWFFENQQRDYE